LLLLSHASDMSGPAHFRFVPFLQPAEGSRAEHSLAQRPATPILLDIPKTPSLPMSPTKQHPSSTSAADEPSSAGSIGETRLATEAKSLSKLMNDLRSIGSVFTYDLCLHCSQTDLLFLSLPAQNRSRASDPRSAAIPFSSPS
jgi:hypothetical protein